MKNLTKENFFNEAMKKYPEAVTKFCQWIDEYKKQNNWNELFNCNSNYQDSNGKNAKAPKFHQIPLEMQQGILHKFFDVMYNGIADLEMAQKLFDTRFRTYQDHLNDELDDEEHAKHNKNLPPIF